MASALRRRMLGQRLVPGGDADDALVRHGVREGKDEIGQPLAQRLLIGPDGGRSRSQQDIEPEHGADRATDVLEQIVHVDRPARGRRRVGKGPELLGQRRSGLGRSPDHPHPERHRIVQQQMIELAANGRHHTPQVVGDPGGQPPERRQPVRLAEARPHREVLADVPDLQQHQPRSLPTLDRSDLHVRGNPTPIALTHAAFDEDRRIMPGAAALERRAHDRHIVGVQHVEKCASRPLVVAPRGPSRRGVVGEGDRALMVDDDHGFAGGVHEHTVQIVDIRRHLVHALPVRQRPCRPVPGAARRATRCIHGGCGQLLGTFRLGNGAEVPSRRHLPMSHSGTAAASR